MKKIANLVYKIDEEVQDAKMYAEMYVEAKAEGDSNYANKLKEISNDEIRHATIMHDKAVEEIEKIRKVFVPPVEMQNEWDLSHREYVERVAWVKQMLAMQSDMIRVNFVSTRG